MHAITKEIVSNYQVRKTRKQKERFRQFLLGAFKEQGIEASIEVSPIIKSANVVVGDVESARYIFSAHYDTQPEMPFPFVLSPFGVRGLLSQLYLAFMMILVLFVLSLALALLFPGPAMIARLSGPVLALVFMFMLLFGKANKHTANDNTSGVCVLVEALMALPESARKQAAFVFFDNEELGVLGASFFKKKHGKRITNTPLINFDCVGNGDVLGFLAHRELFSDSARMDKIREAIPETEGKRALVRSVAKMQYTSDQMIFAKAMGVAAFRESRWLGLHINRIHTRRDTVLDERNIQALQSFVGELLSQ